MSAPLTSPPKPPPRRGPNPFLLLGLVAGSTLLFFTVLQRKQTQPQGRLRAADTIKPGNWMGDQEGVEDPEVERQRRIAELRRAKEEGRGEGVGLEKAMEGFGRDPGRMGEVDGAAVQTVDRSVGAVRQAVRQEREGEKRLV